MLNSFKSLILSPMFTRFALEFIVCFSVTLSGLTFLAWSFWPGLASHDTMFALEQITGCQPYDAVSPALATMLMIPFVNKVSGEIFFLSFQIFVISTLCSFGVLYLFDSGIWRPIKWWSRIPLSATLCFVVTCLPPTGLMNIILWKDIPAAWLLFAQVFSVTALALSLFNLKRQTFRIRIYLLSAVLCGGFASSFRYNSCTVTHVMIFDAFLIFIIISIIWKTVWKRFLFLSFSLYLFLIFGGKGLTWLVCGETAPPFTRDGGLYQWIIVNDFCNALRIGMPLSKDEEKKLLELMPQLNCPYRQLASPFNTFLTSVSLKSAGVSSTDQRREFSNLSTKILMQNKYWWLRSKFQYGYHLLDSVQGYQIPGDASNLECENLMKGRVKLQLNQERSKIREFIRRLMGHAEQKTLLHIIWSFWIALFAILAVILLFFFKLITYISYKKDRFTNSFLFLFWGPIVPVLASIALFVPLWILSVTNDYRYFWPINLFCFIMVVSSFNSIRVGRDFIISNYSQIPTCQKRSHFLQYNATKMFIVNKLLFTKKLKIRPAFSKKNIAHLLHN